MSRIVLLLDVTSSEAQAIAAVLGREGAAPFYEAYNMPTLVDEAIDRTAPGERGFLSMRSKGSAELGGPDMPAIVSRDT